MPDLSSLISTLGQKRQELVRIESELKDVQRQRLKNLSVELGFRDTDELILELAAFASTKLATAIRVAPVIRDRDSKRTQGLPSWRRKPRAVVNDETRDNLVEELKAGTRSAAEIATMFGVSTSLVNQIKQKSGLARKRGKIEAH